MTPTIQRGDVWFVDLSPTQGHEQSGKRPALVVSTNAFNMSRADMAVVIPLTTRQRPVPWHVEVRPPAGGIKRVSYVKCEDVRSISVVRLVRRLGSVPLSTMLDVEQRLRYLLDLP